MVIIDNLSRPLACSRLEQFLTEGVASIRPLGSSTVVTVSPRIFLVITANNAAIRTDMQRRMLPVRIVVPDERPELRRFDFDPVEEVLREREELLRAGLTVLRWQQREPAGADAPMLGSFCDWARLVAGAVRALLGVDLPELIAGRRHDDPAAAAERALFAALFDAFGERPWRATEAVEQLPPDVWTELGLKTGPDGRPDVRTLTAWLRRRRDAVRGAYLLSSTLDRRGFHEWRLLRVGAAAPTVSDCRILSDSCLSRIGDGTLEKSNARGPDTETAAGTKRRGSWAESDRIRQSDNGLGDRGCAGSRDNGSEPAESGTWIDAGDPARWPGELLNRLLEAGGSIDVEAGRLLLRLPPGLPGDLGWEFERRLAEVGR